MQQENEVIKSGIWGRGGSGRCILPSETRFSLYIAVMSTILPFTRVWEIHFAV